MLVRKRGFRFWGHTSERADNETRIWAPKPGFLRIGREVRLLASGLPKIRNSVCAPTFNSLCGLEFSGALTQDHGTQSNFCYSTLSKTTAKLKNVQKFRRDNRHGSPALAGVAALMQTEVLLRLHSRRGIYWPLLTGGGILRPLHATQEDRGGNSTK